MTDKVELKSSHEVIYTVDVADVDSIFQGKPIDPDILTVVMKDGKRLYCDEVCPIDSMQEEPVSEDLKLSWEDIPKIFQISEELKTSWWFRDNEQTKKIGTQVFWEEVLKRFKEGKRDKHKKEDKKI